MKKKNYVHKTITLTCDHCKIKVRVKKNDLNDSKINAIYNHSECLCDHCLYTSPNAYDYSFIRYHYSHSKVSFNIFPKAVTIDEIKNNRKMLESTKKLCDALSSENFGRELQRRYWLHQMELKNLKIIK